MTLRRTPQDDKDFEKIKEIVEYYKPGCDKLASTIFMASRCGDNPQKGIQRLSNLSSVFRESKDKAFKYMHNEIMNYFNSPNYGKITDYNKHSEAA